MPWSQSSLQRSRRRCSTRRHPSQWATLWPSRRLQHSTPQCHLRAWYLSVAVLDQAIQVEILDGAHLEALEGLVASPLAVDQEASPAAVVDQAASLEALADQAASLEASAGMVASRVVEDHLVACHLMATLLEAHTTDRPAAEAADRPVVATAALHQCQLSHRGRAACYVRRRS